MDALAQTTPHSDAVFDLTVLMRVEATKDIAGRVEPGRKHVYAYTVFDADTGEVICAAPMSQRVSWPGSCCREASPARLAWSERTPASTATPSTSRRP